MPIPVEGLARPAAVSRCCRRVDVLDARGIVTRVLPYQWVLSSSPAGDRVHVREAVRPSGSRPVECAHIVLNTGMQARTHAWTLHLGRRGPHDRIPLRYPLTSSPAQMLRQSMQSVQSQQWYLKCVLQGVLQVCCKRCVCVYSLRLPKHRAHRRYSSLPLATSRPAVQLARRRSSSLPPYLAVLPLPEAVGSSALLVAASYQATPSPGAVGAAALLIAAAPPTCPPGGSAALLVAAVSPPLLMCPHV